METEFEIDDDKLTLLKRYRRAVSKLTKSNNRSLKEIEEAHTRIARNNLSIDWLQRQQVILYETDAIISEHALLRYLQRIKGMDLSAIKKQMFTPTLLEKLKANNYADGFYEDGDGTYIVKERTIITIIEKKHA